MLQQEKPVFQDLLSDFYPQDLTPIKELVPRVFDYAMRRKREVPAWGIIADAVTKLREPMWSGAPNEMVSMEIVLATKSGRPDFELTLTELKKWTEEMFEYWVWPSFRDEFAGFTSAPGTAPVEPGARFVTVRFGAAGFDRRYAGGLALFAIPRLHPARFVKMDGIKRPAMLVGGLQSYAVGRTSAPTIRYQQPATEVQVFVTSRNEYSRSFSPVSVLPV